MEREDLDRRHEHEHEHVHALTGGGHEHDEFEAEEEGPGVTTQGAIPDVAPDPDAIPAAPTASERAYGTATVTARRGLRVRSAPNLRAPIIDRLRNGTTVQQLERVGEWVRIAHGGQAAYVHAGYLQASSGEAEQRPSPRPQQPVPQMPVQPVEQQAPVQQAPVQQASVQQTPVQQPTQGRQEVRQRSPSERAYDGAALTETVERVHRGVRIVAPAGTHASAIDRMAAIIDLEIGQNEYAQQHMQAARTTVVIIPTGTSMTDLPQFASMRNQRTFDNREWSTVRGSGGTRAADGSFAVGIAEESLVASSASRNSGYNPEQVAMHEFAHAVHSKGMTPAQQRRVRDLFAQQRSSDSNNDRAEFSDAYAASNVMEYFAQATNVFFGTNAGRDTTGRQKANGREWLRANDPDMYAFLVEMYETRRDRGGDAIS